MKRIIYFAALAALLAGCSKNIQSETLLRDTPISVNVLMPEIQTRAGYDESNLPTKFYLSIDQKGTKYDYNVVMKYEYGKWVAYESDAENAPKKLLLWEGSDLGIFVTAATFPLDGSARYTVSVSDDQSTEAKLKASDYLWYFDEVSPNPNENVISIRFCHIMSKVKIEITLGNEYADNTDPVTSVAILNTNTQAHYALKNGALFGNQSDPKAILACKTGYNPDTRTASFEVILVPQTVAAGSFGLSILVGDNTYEWFSSSAEVTLGSNNEYTLSLTAGKDKVSGNSFTTSEWGSTEGIDRATY